MSRSAAAFDLNTAPAVERTKIGSCRKSRTASNSSFGGISLPAENIHAYLALAFRLGADPRRPYNQGGQSRSIPLLPRVHSRDFARRCAEHIRCHHAEGGPSFYKGAEGECPITENDAVFPFLNDIEIALNATLEVDEHFADLFAIEALDLDRLTVSRVDLVSDCGPDNADVAGGLFEADQIL